MYRPNLPPPFYIGSGETASFAVFHPAPDRDDGARGRPVLFCPPWGWDDVASYRVRREWASRLAAGGSPTLRFDLPATGNSAGSASDRNLVQGWITSVVAAATWLAETEGTADVAALGFGLGGLLAMLAVAAGAPIAALAMWGTPGSGRRFVRETKAFSRMQAWNGDGGADFDPGVPEGWLEAGGFTLSPETLAELKGLDPALEPGTTLQRALLFDRDGVGPEEALAEALDRGGVEVAVAPGPGWGDLVAHPEEGVLPRQVAAELERWLAASPQEQQAGRSERSPAIEVAPTVDLTAADGEVRETAVELNLRWGSTVGVLSETAAGSDSDLCAVFLNAGAVRLTGPNRLWVDTARRWAGLGVRSLRLDLEGIGDADGDAAGELRVADFYAPRYEGQVAEALDWLENRGAGRRFVLVGLCAGGYWAFRTAVDDQRVVACVQLNAGALRWHDELLVRREARKGARALERHWWRKLLGGEIEARRIRELLVSLLAHARLTIARPFRREAAPSTLLAGIEGDLDRLRDAGTSVLIALSGEEPLGAEVERDRLRERSERWPNVEFVTLPGSDHTLRPLVAQKATAELLADEVQRLRGAGAKPDPGGIEPISR
ncbi:MAG TPA: hypothetical protein VGI73_10840 [Solirubrobacterales bacterium]|jgi:alpha-beta hydrolase superfamily lysophospholipase